MSVKTSDWRPGPTVCRCCLSEGCYKDISTEYFWMGKREVYAEMLLDTLNVTIAYSKSGPNSNSRLICEPCISRLRDAHDFKRQVLECEKTFMQHLDPGSSSVQKELEMTFEEVKVERVKKEKKLSDDEDMDDRVDFLVNDDSDDDLDDEPLMKLATKVPKKENSDLLDLLDNTQITVKRKSTPSTSKAKEPPAKKAKKREITIKPTASKATASKAVDKKKKGRKTQQIQIKKEADSDFENYVAIVQGTDDARRRAAFRNNIITILHACTAYPFKYRKGTYLCFYCKLTFLEPEKLREHNSNQHPDPNQLYKPKKYEPIKMDFSNTVCKLCSCSIEDYETLKAHLTAVHGKIIDCTWGDTVLPYKLSKEEHCCQICGRRYEMFLSLHKHMNEHYEHYICETCGKRFATSQRMVNHSRTHERGVFTCKHCQEIFESYSTLYAHIAKVHKLNKRYKCPICDEKFNSYKHRLKHLSVIHGEKTAKFPCPSCPKVFDLCSRRTAHIRFQHLQERNHICSVCGMKFFTNYELTEHSIKHGGERIYQCDVCKKAYARLKTLREHMRIHNNDRRFVCPVCGSSFIQNCSLKQHMRVHHPAQSRDMF